MSPAKLNRTIQRSVHIIASIMLLVYLYTPLGDNDVFNLMLRLMVVPVLAVSGVLMWQWPRIRRATRQMRKHQAQNGIRRQNA